MNLLNLILHITLPQGLKTTDGATLMSPITYDVVSSLSPFYASVDQVKLTGGWALRKLSDITIASQIYMASKAVDMMNYYNPKPNAFPAYPMFVNARNQWVIAKASNELILSLGALLGPGSHVLANFSVSTTRNFNTEGVSGKLADLSAMMKLYDPTIRSGGRVEPGGHSRPKMGAKGVMDWTERTPGRTWARNSVGANSETFDYGSASGGRGKPVSFFSHSIYSPSLTAYRVGNYQSGYNLYARGFPF